MEIDFPVFFTVRDYPSYLDDIKPYEGIAVLSSSTVSVSRIFLAFL